MGGEEPELGLSSELITCVPFGVPADSLVAVLEREPLKHSVRREVVRHTPQLEVVPAPIVEPDRAPASVLEVPSPLAGPPPNGTAERPRGDDSSLLTASAFIPPDPVLRVRKRFEPQKSKRSWPLAARIVGGLFALSLAPLGFLIVAARSGSGSVLAHRVASSLGVDKASPEELAEGVDDVVEERDRVVAQLSEEEASHQAAVTELEQASADRDAAMTDRDAVAAELGSYQALFPLSADDLQGAAADFTSAALTMTATPEPGGCLGFSVESCTAQHVGRSIAVAVQWDPSSGWVLTAPEFGTIPLALDPSAGVLSGSAPVTLGWTCADGSTGQPGTVAISMRPTRWTKGDAVHRVRVTGYTGDVAEDGGAEGACAFSGLRWSFQLAE